MNNDLISRTALLKEIKLQKSYAGEMRQQSYRTGFIVSLSMLEGKIAEIPVVDAEPVRYGQWLDTPIGLIKCSECGYAFNLVEMVTHYCPNCGTRMGAEENT